MSVRDGHAGRPGALVARSTTGSIEVPPEPGRIVRFGRGGEEADARVDLHVGVEDLGVSRRHGELTCSQGYWWLRNTGRRLLRLPSTGRLPERLYNGDEPVPLEAGHTHVYVMGSTGREYVVELHVFGDEKREAPPVDARTVSPKRWGLDDDERLVLVAMGPALRRLDEPT